jgi:hypothetical protein
MLRESFIVVLGVGALILAVPSCEPEAFHESLGVGGSGAAGALGAGAGPSGGVGGSAEAQGAAGNAPVAGSGGGGEAGSTTAVNGAVGSTPLAGVGGQRSDAGTTSDARADTSGGGPPDALHDAPPATPYTPTGWKATAPVTSPKASQGPPNALDGNVATRWTTGRSQMGNESFEIDFGITMSVSRVVLDDTMFPQDFPVAYLLELSADGTTFMAVSMGKGATVTNIEFGMMNARYIRIRETASGTKWWSIGELRVYP